MTNFKIFSLAVLGYFLAQETHAASAPSTADKMLLEAAKNASADGETKLVSNPETGEPMFYIVPLNPGHGQPQKSENLIPGSNTGNARSIVIAGGVGSHDKVAPADLFPGEPSNH